MEVIWIEEWVPKCTYLYISYTYQMNGRSGRVGWTTNWLIGQLTHFLRAPHPMLCDCLERGGKHGAEQNGRLGMVQRGHCVCSWSRLSIILHHISTCLILSRVGYIVLELISLVCQQQIVDYLWVGKAHRQRNRVASKGILSCQIHRPGRHTYPYIRLNLFTYPKQAPSTQIGRLYHRI